MSEKYAKDDLGVKMKEYEHAYRYCLSKRLPVMIRIDGKGDNSFK